MAICICFILISIQKVAKKMTPSPPFSSFFSHRTTPGTHQHTSHTPPHIYKKRDTSIYIYIRYSIDRLIELCDSLLYRLYRYILYHHIVTNNNNNTENDKQQQQ